MWIFCWSLIRSSKKWLSRPWQAGGIFITMMMDSFPFVLHQGFAIYFPSGQLAKLHQIQRWTSQTTDRRQVQGEQLEAINPLSKEKNRNLWQPVFLTAPSSVDEWASEFLLVFIHMAIFFFFFFSSLSFSFLSCDYSRAQQRPYTHTAASE